MKRNRDAQMVEGGIVCGIFKECGSFWGDCAREKLDRTGRELDSGRAAGGDVTGI